MIVFIDESGNTGTQTYKDVWNFIDQPIFVLCAISVPENNEIKDKLLRIFSSNKIQGELKFSNRKHKKMRDRLIPQLYDFLIENGCDIYIEAVNKKYAVSHYITDYCLVPYYDSPPTINFDKLKLLKMTLSNYVYDNTPDALLGDFASIFDANDQDITKFIKKCRELREVFKNEQIKNCVDETIDSIENYEKLGLSKHHLFPLIDYNKGNNSTVAICPQIDSFNNIISRISNTSNKFDIIHDEQHVLCDALTSWAQKRVEMNNLSCNISFGNSESHEMIQVADYFAGNIRSYIEKIVTDSLEQPSEYLDKILSQNTNFVSNIDEQCAIFTENEELLMQKKMYENEFRNSRSI